MLQFCSFGTVFALRYSELHKSARNPREFYTFAGMKFFDFEVYYNMGMTGFDSRISWNISMSSNEIELVNLNFNFINGEDNYALAA